MWKNQLNHSANSEKPTGLKPTKKLSFSRIATALAVVLLNGGATTALATPAENLEARQLPVGGIQACSLSGQCLGTFFVPPIEGAFVCVTFATDFATQFLNHNLGTLAFDSTSCSAFSGSRCTGTNLGGDVALGGTTTVDYSARNASTLISSIQCTFQ